ncbi:MAG TPA: SH3 domain-containing protein [Candidatus Limnocylindria bacterium]|nr:SH3 domain-containing protein [Candidatus Limnocylindria bacterium]
MDPYRPEPVRCPRCGSTNPSTAAFCAECGLGLVPDQRPDRARAVESKPNRRPIFIALAVVVAAIAVGAGFALLTRPGEAQLAAATTSPSPSASASVAGAASPSAAAATPTPQPTPVPNPVLANGAIADVAVDELNVRVAGSSSAEVLGQLRAGARVFIIGAPVAEGDTNWYRVAVVSGAFAGYTPCPNYGCSEGIGYVATPITGDAWLEEVEIGCPSSPMTATDLVELLPLERLHCFGNDDIVVTGMIDTPCCGYVGPIAYEPAWLARPANTAYFADAAMIQFRTDPAAGLASPERGDVVRATGHFDDPASPECRAFGDPSVGAEDFDPSQIPTTAEIVLTCRTQIAFSDYQVTEHKDLGPCCGMLEDGAPGAAKRRPMG